MVDPERAEGIDGGAPRSELERERRREFEHLASLAALAGEVAHGFNNHLTAILGYTDLVADQVAEMSAHLVEDVGEIRNAARRAQGLTQQLLAIAGRQVLRMRVVDLNETVAETARRLAAEFGEDVDVQVAAAPDLGPVEADPDELGRALVELAVNARDALPAGGSLTLRTSNVELTEELAADLPNAKPGPHVVIEVTDAGAGIPAAVLPKIFTPFFSTKNGVTSRPGGDAKGLGLSLVHGIVDQHGGHVRVRSEVGVGTTVELFLPRSARPGVDHS